MAKYYVIVTDPVNELEYTDISKRTARTFNTWKSADNYGLQNIGIGNYEVAKVIDAIASQREPKE